MSLMVRIASLTVYLDVIERSEGLMKHYKFKTPVTLYHDGGHYLPSNAASRQTYKSFVESFI